MRPCFGESCSGDAVFYRELESGVFAAVVDALGHGPRAHETAQLAIGYLQRAAGSDVLGVMEKLNGHLKGSLGVAAGLCFIDLPSGALRYAGVGNTVIRRFGSSDTRLISRDGVLGALRVHPREESMTLFDGDVLLLYTDGVRAHFVLSEYPQIFGHSARTIAAQVVRRFGRDRDDAGCLALKYRA